jgi:glyoxylase-like metal-dependent hydrolase (beta-lactamase superfamily II)
MVEITSTIHQVDDVICNSYLVLNADGTVSLIDTGMPGDAKRILDYMVIRTGHQPTDLKTIILTHCHVDHVGSASELKRLTGANVLIHKDDAGYLAGREKLPPTKGIVGLVLRMVMKSHVFETIEPDLILNDGDKVGDLDVVHVPGHTPGSIALQDKNRKIIFVGDALNFSDNKVQGPTGELALRYWWNLESAKRSVGRISKLEFDMMLSGHGTPLKSNTKAIVRNFYLSLR